MKFTPTSYTCHRVVSTGWDNKVIVWDTVTGKPLVIFANINVHAWHCGITLLSIIEAFRCFQFILFHRYFVLFNVVYCFLTSL